MRRGKELAIGGIVLLLCLYTNVVILHPGVREPTLHIEEALDKVRIVQGWTYNGSTYSRARSVRLDGENASVDVPFPYPVALIVLMIDKSILDSGPYRLNLAFSIHGVKGMDVLLKVEKVLANTSNVVQSSQVFPSFNKTAQLPGRGERTVINFRVYPLNSKKRTNGSAVRNDVLTIRTIGTKNETTDRNLIERLQLYRFRNIYYTKGKKPTGTIPMGRFALFFTLFTIAILLPSVLWLWTEWRYGG